jgi:hypothetical protein
MTRQGARRMSRLRSRYRSVLAVVFGSFVLLQVLQAQPQQNANSTPTSNGQGSVTKTPSSVPANEPLSAPDKAGLVLGTGDLTLNMLKAAGKLPEIFPNVSGLVGQVPSYWSLAQAWPDPVKTEAAGWGLGTSSTLLGLGAVPGLGLPLSATGLLYTVAGSHLTPEQQNEANRAGFNAGLNFGLNTVAPGAGFLANAIGNSETQFMPPAVGTPEYDAWQRNLAQVATETLGSNTQFVPPDSVQPEPMTQPGGTGLSVGAVQDPQLGTKIEILSPPTPSSIPFQSPEEANPPTIDTVGATTASAGQAGATSEASNTVGAVAPDGIVIDSQPTSDASGPANGIVIDTPATSTNASEFASPAAGSSAPGIPAGYPKAADTNGNYTSFSPQNGIDISSSQDANADGDLQISSELADDQPSSAASFQGLGASGPLVNTLASANNSSGGFWQNALQITYFVLEVYQGWHGATHQWRAPAAVPSRKQTVQLPHGKQQYCSTGPAEEIAACQLAFWSCGNILGGTSGCVSEFPGYHFGPPTSIPHPPLQYRQYASQFSWNQTNDCMESPFPIECFAAGGISITEGIGISDPAEYISIGDPYD